MTVFINQSSLDNDRHPHKYLTNALIVLAASTLFACSQPETGATDSNAIKPEPPVIAVTASEIPTTPTINIPENHSNLLKNVSATVYKDANCGCCKDWISHAESHGLTATAKDVTDLALFKDRYGVPDNMRSCHTAVTTDGYVFEGHVPAKYVEQFLANPPVQALGLAVPGMPMGSPGMEYQNQFDPYQIMQINKDGSSEVYMDIQTAEQQL